LQSRIARASGNIVRQLRPAGLWKGFAIRDGNLVTGQRNFSAAEEAEVVIRAFGE